MKLFPRLKPLRKQRSHIYISSRDEIQKLAGKTLTKLGISETRKSLVKMLPTAKKVKTIKINIRNLHEFDETEEKLKAFVLQQDLILSFTVDNFSGIVDFFCAEDSRIDEVKLQRLLRNRGFQTGEAGEYFEKQKEANTRKYVRVYTGSQTTENLKDRLARQKELQKAKEEEEEEAQSIFSAVLSYFWY